MMHRAYRVVRLAPALAALWAGLAGGGRAARADGDVVESYEVDLPVTPGDRLVVDNPLGPVVLKAWDRPEIRILADKRGPSHELVSRLRVHGTLGDGVAQVTTRLLLIGPQGEIGLPMWSVSVALEVDAPRGMQVVAQTFNGDLSADGFSAGAALVTNGGHVQASNIGGDVSTRAEDGDQELDAIRGDVDSVGGDGDVDLDDVRGQRLDARVQGGSIHARRVQAGVVHLSTLSGDITFSGMINDGGSYQLATYSGSVQAQVSPADGGFTLLAASPSPPEIGGVLVAAGAQGGVTRAVYGAGSARMEIVTQSGTIAVGVVTLAP
jgi:hypothetical protein